MSDRKEPLVHEELLHDLSGFTEDEPVERARHVSGKFGSVKPDRALEAQIQASLDSATEQDFPDDTTPDHLAGLINERNTDDQMIAPSGSKLANAMARMVQWVDPLNHADDAVADARSNKASWPKKLYLGYMTQVKKKDLLRYIGEWVNDNADTKAGCFYQIVPWNGGFAFEIQEGGAGHGVLKTALEVLAREGEVTLPAVDRFVQIALKPVGFTTYLLNEFEEQQVSEGLIFKDPLSPVYTRNHGLMLSGVIAALLGILVFLGSWVVVYSVYNKDKVPVFSKATYQLPWQNIDKIDAILTKPNTYLSKLTFGGGNWKLEEMRVEPATLPAQPQTTQPVPMDEPLATQVPLNGQPAVVAGTAEENTKMLNELEKTIAESKN
jgi:hypothetical protein